MDEKVKRAVEADQFWRAVTEAEEIILYCVRRGIEVPKELLKAVTAARNKGTLERLSEDDQIELWQAAQALAKLVQPVTINSIRARGSATATFVWSIFSVLLLAALVTTQIVWVLGTNIVNDIKQIDEGMQKARVDLSLADAQLLRIEGQSASPSTLAPDAAGGEQRLPAALSAPVKPAPKTTARPPRQRLPAALSAPGTLAPTTTSAPGQRLPAALSAPGTLAPTTTSAPGASELNPDPIEIRRKFQEANAAFNRKTDEREGAFARLESWAALVPIVSRSTDEDSPVKDQFLLGSANAGLNAMSGYVLPLLYGLLGAAAYVMRSLSKEISEVTFSFLSNVRFMLRLVLGMLAGISVGLVLRPESLPAAVPPLALAFLAGYSVELLFSAMDRLIAAFSSEGTRSPSK